MAQGIDQVLRILDAQSRQYGLLVAEMGKNAGFGYGGRLRKWIDGYRFKARRTFYRNAWPNVLRRQILDFEGLKVTHMVTVGPIRGAKSGADAGWFKAARTIAG